MISKQDVKKLADLARLSLSESEMERFPEEIDSILGYVGKVKDAASKAPNPVFESVNTLREDVVVHASREYTDRLLDASPKSSDGYVEVKKILE